MPFDGVASLGDTDRSAEQVELATAAWVDWWNRRRLHSAASNLPSAE